MLEPGDSPDQVAEQLAGLEAMFVGLLRRAVADRELDSDLDERRWGRFLTTTSSLPS